MCVPSSLGTKGGGKEFTFSKSKLMNSEPSPLRKRELKNDITLSQRMGSACVGSVLTSLVVTPFDVVRIRLQQQEMLFPPGVLNAGQCCRKVFWEEDSPGLAPKGKESLFCMENSCAEEARISGTMTGISKIATNEGIRALYRGLFLTLVMAVPSNVVYFSGYDILRDSSPLEDSHPVINPLICGAFARILAATSVAPLELIKTRLQAVPATHRNVSSSIIMNMVLKNTWNEMKENGIGSIFKGLQLTLWRDVPFSGIYWAAYESLSSCLKNTRLLNEAKDDDPDRGMLNRTIFARSFICGSLAGVIAALFTNPFDVGKTRFQVASEQENRYGSLAPLATNNSQASIEKGQPMFNFLYTIYRTEGIGALYVGIIPRCLKIAPACAIMISTYEVSKKFFKNLRESKNGSHS
ncbi:DEKNAAC100831 [Brettanomyces naardenensis]|uniref:DEKNAAC100831 n=1 Tax=Brettanomyces naardenensis TaxID=13370 RepID=A0A448YFV4_BRENA|nr:DEKNAAC100831 [Brettanomyces naardenensis]